jgi:hypothetical protein
MASRASKKPARQDMSSRYCCRGIAKALSTNCTKPTASACAPFFARSKNLGTKTLGTVASKLWLDPVRQRLSTYDLST